VWLSTEWVRTMRVLARTMNVDGVMEELADRDMGGVLDLLTMEHQNNPLKPYRLCVSQEGVELWLEGRDWGRYVATYPTPEDGSKIELRPLVAWAVAIISMGGGDG